MSNVSSLSNLKSSINFFNPVISAVIPIIKYSPISSLVAINAFTFIIMKKVTDCTVSYFISENNKSYLTHVLKSNLGGVVGAFSCMSVSKIAYEWILRESLKATPAVIAVISGIAIGILVLKLGQKCLGTTIVKSASKIPNQKKTNSSRKASLEIKSNHLKAQSKVNNSEKAIQEQGIGLKKRKSSKEITRVEEVLPNKIQNVEAQIQVLVVSIENYKKQISILQEKSDAKNSRIRNSKSVNKKAEKRVNESRQASIQGYIHQKQRAEQQLEEAKQELKSLLTEAQNDG